MSDAKTLAAGKTPSGFQHLLEADQSVLEAIPAAVYVCSADGRTVRYNRRATELWGGEIPQPRVTEKTFGAAFRLRRADGRPLPPADTPMQTVLRTGGALHEEELIIERRDGSRVVVLVDAQSFRGDDKRLLGAVICFQDITARKTAEEEIRRSRADLEDFFANAVVAMHWVGADGIILHANQAEIDLLGYAREEYVGRHVAEFHADRAAIDEILARLSRGEQVEHFPARLRARDGSIKPVRISSNTRFRDGEMANTRCITLDASAEHFKLQLAAIVESSDDAIISKDLDGVITSWNRGAERLYGYSAADAIGRPIAILIPPDHQNEEQDILARIRRGERVEPFETIRLRKDGSPVDISLTVSPVIDGTGRVVGASKVARDITNRKEAERALARRIEEQTALYRFVDRLQRAETVEEIYEAALDAILQALHCERASILLFDEAGAMRFVAARGLSERYMRAVDGHTPWTAEAPDPQPVCIDDIDSADMPETLRATVKAEGIGALAFIPFKATGRLTGKFMTYYEAPHAFGDAEIELSLAVARQLGFSIERWRTEQARRAAEAALRESEHRLEYALTAGGLGAWEWNTATGEVIWSPGLEQIHGLEPGTFGGRFDDFRRDIHPDDLERVLAEIERTRMERDFHLVYRIRRPDGAERWVESFGRPVPGANGAPMKMSGVCMDVTERKNAEEHQALLINELNHRVKNTLATVQAIAAQTFRGAGVDPAMQQRLEGRLIALSGAHGILTEENWEGADIRQLIGEAVRPLADPERLRLDGPSLRLSPKAAVAIAMAMHELATNAGKYGALSNGTGRIDVTWVAAEPTDFTLEWKESGGPAVCAPQRRGFGSRLIERNLAHDLDGEAKLEFRPEGVLCTIAARLDDIGILTGEAGADNS